MPFALAIIGVVLLVAGVRNKQADLFTLVKGDFTGKNNFVFWMASIFFIGAIGYIPKLKPISTGFIALIIVVLFLKKGTGFFDRFTEALGMTATTNLQPSATQAPAPASTDTPVGNDLGQYLQALKPLGGIQ